MLAVCVVGFGRAHRSCMSQGWQVCCLADYVSTSDASTASDVLLDTEAEVELGRLDSHVFTLLHDTKGRR